MRLETDGEESCAGAGSPAGSRMSAAAPAATPQLHTSRRAAGRLQLGPCRVQQEIQKATGGQRRRHPHPKKTPLERSGMGRKPQRVAASPEGSTEGGSVIVTANRRTAGEVKQL